MSAAKTKANGARIALAKPGSTVTLAEWGRRDRAQVHESIEHALQRLAVLETTIRRLPLADTTLRDGLVLTVADIVSDVADARALTPKGA